jgi:two-component system, OmpR family, copper resistance phosphate regulon response regulator CusR
VKTLLIEDSVKTARALKSGLASEGFDVRIARNGEEGYFLLNTEDFDLVVLDWMLPGRDGLEVLRALRGSGKKTPVLLLTARDAVEDRVAGLNAGADDYLVKPFAFVELVARLRALLRRTADDEPRVWNLGDLSLDLHARRVMRGGREIALTPREFELLAYLLTHQGAPVTRQMIGRDVWREPNRATSLDNVIDVHLAHLRRKIDDGQSVRLIHTVRGVGFVARTESSP